MTNSQLASARPPLPSHADATAGPALLPPLQAGPAISWRKSLSCIALTGLTLVVAGCGQTSSARAQTNRAPSSLAAADASRPVVLELYQSQGCSSCPPANANINAIADQPGILALSFAVTYWDKLGWKDIFAQPAYTQRQWDYANTSGRGEVYTPQVVINGRNALVGADKTELRRSIAAAGPVAQRLEYRFVNGKVALSGVTARVGTSVWLARFDPNLRNVPIRSGENSGRTLPHKNIVRELVKLGPWTGQFPEFALPQAHEMGLASAILVQAGQGGPIVAARRL